METKKNESLLSDILNPDDQASPENHTKTLKTAPFSPPESQSKIMNHPHNRLIDNPAVGIIIRLISLLAVFLLLLEFGRNIAFR